MPTAQWRRTDLGGQMNLALVAFLFVAEKTPGDWRVAAMLQSGYTVYLETNYLTFALADAAMNTLATALNV